MGPLVHWRLLALGLAVAALVGFVSLALHWRKEAAVERLRADMAVLQTKVDTETSQITDRVATDKVIIIRETEERASVVEAIPSDDIPADVLNGWRDGLRHGSAGDNPDRAAKPAGTLR